MRGRGRAAAVSCHKKDGLSVPLLLVVRKDGRKDVFRHGGKSKKFKQKGSVATYAVCQILVESVV